MKNESVKAMPGKPISPSDILESIPIGIIILDPEGRIVMMNRWQEKISQVQREQVLGTHFHETWKRLFDQGIYDAYWDLIKNKQPYNLILHEVFPQFYERRITAIARGAPLASGNGFVLLHEVSETMQQDKRGLEKLAGQLAESMNFLSNLIDSSPNIVITTDRDDMIRSANETGVQVFGYTKGNFIGSHVAFLLERPSDLIRYQVMAEKETGVEISCKKKNGRVFPTILKIRDIKRKTGEIQAKLFLFTDITKEKDMEAKLALSEKLAIYSELMAGIAHQINNPLVGVVNFSALLLEKLPQDDSNRALAETIFQASQECKRMISTLIKGIREPKSTFHPVDIRETLENAIVYTCRDESEKASGISLTKRIQKTIPAVQGDSLQLFQVFRNILTNSFQAMPDGGRLNVSTKVDAVRREVHVRFSDTGIGIPQENLPHVFEPFFSTKGKPGTGLGLSFAYQVVKAHSGRIVVDSSPMKGSVFAVILPYIHEEDR